MSKFVSNADMIRVSSCLLIMMIVGLLSIVAVSATTPKLLWSSSPIGSASMNANPRDTYLRVLGTPNDHLIYAQGSIMINSPMTMLNMAVYGLHKATGATAWNYTTNQTDYGTYRRSWAPLSLGEQHVYFSGFAGLKMSRLVALDRTTGKEAWSFIQPHRKHHESKDARFRLGVAKEHEGTVFIALGDDFHALDTQTGLLLWRRRCVSVHDPDAFVTSFEPAIDEVRKHVVTMCDCRMVAFRTLASSSKAAGSVVWNVSLPHSSDDSGDLNCQRAHVVAAQKDGEDAIAFSFFGVGQSNENLVRGALSLADGSVIWSSRSFQDQISEQPLVLSPPAAAADSVVVAHSFVDKSSSSASSGIRGVSITNGTEVWKFERKNSSSQPFSDPMAPSAKMKTARNQKNSLAVYATTLSSSSSSIDLYAINVTAASNVSSSSSSAVARKLISVDPPRHVFINKFLQAGPPLVLRQESNIGDGSSLTTAYFVGLGDPTYGTWVIAVSNV